jgi:peptidoglycan/LPS O-acetylase OafA/YrhL
MASDPAPGPIAAVDGRSVTEFVKSPARLGQRDRLAHHQGPVLSTDALIQPPQHHAYRPDIDGLRAVAVLMVVLYHFALPTLAIPGGYTGVDVFFVISGYLITRLLMAAPADAGALGEFYLRRFRRLYPALLVVVTATLIAGYFLMMPGDYLDLGESARYAVFALGNLHFYGNTGYFDQAAELQPLLHTWSLAVEEQFYLVWPFVILAARRLGGSRAVLGTCIAVVVAGFAYAGWAVQWEAKLAFYSPLSRAWELGLGALMVFVPALRSRRTATWANGAGIALIAWSAFALSDATVFPGPSALFACLGSALLVWAKDPGTWVSRLLAAEPMRTLGLLSYSLYLWHWPVLVFALHDSGAALSAAQGLVLLALVLVLAWMSWRWVEEPFRRRAFTPQTGRLLAAGGILAPCLLAAVIVLGGGLMNRLEPRAVPMSSLDVMWEWQPQQITQTPLHNQLAFGAPWDEARYRIVLWGDSHAEHLAPLLERTMAARETTDVAVWRRAGAV